MKLKLINIAIASAIAAWAPASFAREAIALPGVVSAEGVLNGVDTTGDATLTVGDNQNINTSNDLGGAFTTASGGTGEILFSGSSTVTGSTGQTGTRYRNISAGAAGETVTFNGALFAQTLAVSGTGTVNLLGDVIAAPNFVGDGVLNLGAGKSLIGAITTNTANTGTLTLNNGSRVTGAIGGANGLKFVRVSGGNASITGAVQAQGFELGANTLIIDGALTTNAGGTIATSLAGNAVYGNIQPNGSSNIDASGITVIPTVTGILTPGTTFTIVKGLSGTVGSVVNVRNTNPLYTFSSVPTTTGDVLITVESVPLTQGQPVVNGATPVIAPVVAALAPVILAAPAATGSDLQSVQSTILALPTLAAVSNALSQLAPGSTNLAAPWVAGQASGLMDDALLTHLDEIQGQCCDTSCKPNAVESPKCETDEQRNNLWLKGFGNRGNQDDVAGISGYDTKAYGLVLGYDVPVNDLTRVGLSAGYVQSDIDENGFSGKTTVDSYQLKAYAEYAPAPWYVQGSLAAGVDRYDGSRQITYPGVNRTADSSYDGQQYTALVSAGKYISFERDITVTPFVSLQASNIQVDSYTERGAGDLNLAVKEQNYDVIQSGLGVKAERVIRVGKNSYTPEIHTKWLHDFNSTTMQQTAALTGGGSAFKVEGIDQDRDLYNVGAGLTFLSCNCSKDSWAVKGQYDYKWNTSDYSANQFSLIANLNF
jgi:outer membrane autotransporter protein